MAKVQVFLPEPPQEFNPESFRQINAAIETLQNQLNTNYQKEALAIHTQTQIRKQTPSNTHTQRPLLYTRIPTPHWKHLHLGNLKLQNSIHPNNHPYPEKNHKTDHQHSPKNTYTPTVHTPKDTKHMQPLYPQGMRRDAPIYTPHKTPKPART